jgi:septum formation protein
LFLKSPPSLILASTSPYRRQLLERLRVPFSCSAPGVDETRRSGERPLELAVRLARAKALAVALQNPHAWVVGSDQVALRVDRSLGELILGKPGTEAHCIEQLRASSGQILSFMTAVAVVRHTDPPHEFVDTTQVTFRTLDDATIARYVALEQPFDCAGGFKSEGLGITLCESINGTDPSALIGLPLIQLSRVLRSVGFELP